MESELIEIIVVGTGILFGTILGAGLAIWQHKKAMKQIMDETLQTHKILGVE